MYDKWSAKKTKKGYLRIHVAINVNTKEILALEITDEKVHDGKMMKKLVEHVLKSNSKNVKIKSVLADGANDTNKNFGYLQEKGITPGIKVRKTKFCNIFST